MNKVIIKTKTAVAAGEEDIVTEMRKSKSEMVKAIYIAGLIQVLAIIVSIAFLVYYLKR